MKKKLPFVAALIFLASSCVKGNEATYSFPMIEFSTGINCSYISENDINEELKDLIDKIGRMCDPYKNRSEVSLYNLNKNRQLVDEEGYLTEILSSSIECIDKSEGYFSPYLGSLTLLWKNKLYGGVEEIEDYEPILPNQEEIEEALNKANSTSILINEKTITLSGDGDIDLGGAAKGYTLSKIKDIFKKKKITSYYLNAGSSSILFGKNQNGASFEINMRDFPGYKFKIKDASIGVSGIKEQKVEIEGKEYSHLINPFTGEATTLYESVIIKHQDPLLCDIFSTACMFLDKEKIEALSIDNGFSYAIFGKEGLIHEKGIR